MAYSIYITAAAERDLLRATDYIDSVLKNSKAADDLLDEAETKINALTVFPKKFKLVDDPVLASWGIHFVVVKGYLAFYVVSDEKQQITIVRFLFQKSNWAAILRQDLSLS
ncbi:MAG: type II toxin-antitoxin system RelE/ParE family toxin [Eubacteriaceae bacterium]|jgi:plasmid stabilization system protein ParE